MERKGRMEGSVVFTCCFEKPRFFTFLPSSFFAKRKWLFEYFARLGSVGYKDKSIEVRFFYYNRFVIVVVEKYWRKFLQAWTIFTNFELCCSKSFFLFSQSKEEDTEGEEDGVELLDRIWERRWSSYRRGVEIKFDSQKRVTNEERCDDLRKGSSHSVRQA